MILWDNDGKSVLCDINDLTPGVMDFVAGVSDSFERGICPFCNRSYSQEISCHHLRNILPVDGDAYWHRAFIRVDGARFQTVGNNDLLEGPPEQPCESCRKSVPKDEMVHVMFVEEGDLRVRVASYCSDSCASEHWECELKSLREKEAVQIWLRESSAS